MDATKPSSWKLLSIGDIAERQRERDGELLVLSYFKCPSADTSQDVSIEEEYSLECGLWLRVYSGYFG